MELSSRFKLEALSINMLVSNQNPELQDLLENHFGLQDTFKWKMNGSFRRKLRNIYSSPKPVLKIKPNKLLPSQ